MDKQTDQMVLDNIQRHQSMWDIVVSYITDDPLDSYRKDITMDIFVQEYING